MNKPKVNLLLYVVLLAVILYLCISYFTPSSGVQVDYSTVRTLFQEEKVRAFTVEDGVLTLTLREPDKDGNTAYEHKLADEEMYGEYFDIPKPDDLVFVSWFAGGEVFRSGCTWTRGMGRIFYFQPGHETQPSYYVPEVRQILKNAVRWAAPTVRVDSLDCPHTAVAPEAKYREGK